MKNMNENLADNLGSLFVQLQEEVVKGLEEFFLVNNNLLFEKA